MSWFTNLYYSNRGVKTAGWRWVLYALLLVISDIIYGWFLISSGLSVVTALGLPVVLGAICAVLGYVIIGALSSFILWGTENFGPALLALSFLNLFGAWIFAF